MNWHICISSIQEEIIIGIGIRVIHNGVFSVGSENKSRLKQALISEHRSRIAIKGSYTCSEFPFLDILWLNGNICIYTQCIEPTIPALIAHPVPLFTCTVIKSITTRWTDNQFMTHTHCAPRYNICDIITTVKLFGTSMQVHIYEHQRKVGHFQDTCPAKLQHKNSNKWKWN